MKCPNCDAGNPDLARFCLNCGESLDAGGARACPRCGGDIPATAHYCPGCGRPVEGMGDSSSLGRGTSLPAEALQRLMPKQYLRQLLAQRGKVTGERRVITIMFFDIVDSTGIAESLDPEDVVDVMNGAFELLVKPIYKYKGTLARLMGDGILSFFGAPIAHEDDPIRACHAALDVIRSARDYADILERERGIQRFDVRVGINTGLVVVGEVGADLRVEYTAMGDAVNLAARMESNAEPGTVMITENTRRLLQDAFETEDVGLIPVKGKSEPVHVCRVVRARRKPDFETAHAHSPLVGRDAEMSRLLDAIHDLRSGRGSALSIVAETGLGKSRLISEARGARSEEETWGEGRGASYTAEIGYWVAAEVLRGLLGVDLADDPAVVDEALRESLEGIDDAGELYTPLARILNLPVDRAAQGGPADETAQRRRMTLTFCEYIERLSSARPVVLVWENLHWADPHSLDILESLVALAEHSPLLLLSTYRPEDGVMHALETRLRERHGERFEVLRLRPLDRHDSVELVHNLVDGKTIPEDVLRVITEGSEGNAFFLEEILRSLLETNLLVVEEDRVVASPGFESVDIPTTVHGAIMSRVDQLFPRDKRTLQTASVIGRAFPQSVLTRVAGDDIGHDHVADSIGTLQQRDFLHEGEEVETSTDEESQRSPLDESVYVFRHSMTAEVVYSSMLKSQRKRLHERTGRAIEKLFPDRVEDVSPLLAFHFEKSDAADKAFEYIVLAARRAAGVYANAEAIGRYTRALEYAESAPDDAIAAAREGLGDVYYLTSDYASAMEQYERAFDLVDDSARRVTLNRKRGQLCEKWGRYDEAERYFETALGELRHPVDAKEAAHVYNGLGMAFYHRESFDDAVDHLKLAADMMTTIGNDAGLAEACNNLGVVFCRKREWDTAVEHLSKSLSIWQGLRDSYGLAASHNNMGLVYHRRGDADRAASHFETSLGLFERVGNLHGLARTYDNLSHVYMDAGEREQAMDYVKKSVAILAKISVDRQEMSPEMWQSGEW